MGLIFFLLNQTSDSLGTIPAVGRNQSAGTAASLFMYSRLSGFIVPLALITHTRTHIQRQAPAGCVWCQSGCTCSVRKEDYLLRLNRAFGTSGLLLRFSVSLIISFSCQITVNVSNRAADFRSSVHQCKHTPESRLKLSKRIELLY